MSEIRFVNELGDVLEQAAGRRLRHGGNRMRLVVVAAALSLVAGVAIAATIGSPTQLVMRPISCFAGTSPSPLVRGAFGISSGGRNPIEMCALQLQVSPRTLVACSHRGPFEVRWRGQTWSPDPEGRVFVFASDRKPNQCARLGMSSLPASYAAAAADVRALVGSLRAAYQASNCTSAAALVADTRRILRDQGFPTWKVVVLKNDPIQWTGPCAAYLPDGPNWSDPSLALSDSPSTVEIVDRVASRSVVALAKRLAVRSGARCHSAAGTEEVVRDAIQSVVPGATVRYAITARPAGNRLDPRWLNERYAAGCAVAFETYPGVDGRSFRIWLVSRFGAAQPRPLPSAAFR